MSPDYFPTLRSAVAGIALAACANFASAESSHGIAMYGDPALPPDFVSLPYANPDAPKGGRIVFGETQGVDSLNPFVQKGTPPWQMRYWAYESLMGRSYDEPFTLYGLLAESIETPEDRSWVEFTLREEARFWDGSPVTVEDVIWSYETLGTKGHGRYRGFWGKVEKIEATGPRSVRISFNTEDRELALLAGLRPIIKKAQWEGREFGEDPTEAPIGTAPYQVTDFEFGRQVTFSRVQDYWGADLGFRRGTNNLDEMRLDYFGDASVVFEAFKAGELSANYEWNAEKWASQYDFPLVQDGDILKAEIPSEKPSGIRGLVMNTRRAPFDDWRVREAMIQALNFEYGNDTINGGTQERITSYFSGSVLALKPGAADGRVLELLEPFKADLLPGTIEGYELPVTDGSARNRKGIRAARALLEEAGWTVADDGVLRNEAGEAFEFEVVLRQGDSDYTSIMNIFTPELERLGIKVTTSVIDSAQFAERETSYDFDMTTYWRVLSLSPGNEQRYYWGKEGVETPGTRNLMGARNPAIEPMIDAMLSARSNADFTSAVQALDRVLTSGRYVIPMWNFGATRIAHSKDLHYPKDSIPMYGGHPAGFLPYVWWHGKD